MTHAEARAQYTVVVLCVWCPSMAGESKIIGVGDGDGAGVAHREEILAEFGVGGGVGAGAAHGTFCCLGGGAKKFRLFM